MLHHAVVQGSEEWLRLRLGIPTASEFSRILTPAKQQLAAGRFAYQLELVTELVLDGPLDTATTPAMLHGHDWEAKALAAYEMEKNVDVEPVGFCTTDDQRIGASPDGFVGLDGSLELKCPFKPQVHVGYLLNPQSFVDEHYMQVQGQLLVTGRKWTDLVSYFMGLPTVTVRITPGEEFQGKLRAALAQFLDELEVMKAKVKAAGCKFPRENAKQAPAPADYEPPATQGDISELIAAGIIQPGDRQ